MPLIKSTLKIGDNSSNAHDHITVDGEFVGNLIPNANASFDIGSSTKVWNNLYVANISTNIANKYLLYSSNGTISGIQQLQYEGSPYHRFALGTGGNYYGKLAVLDGHSAPFQSYVSNVDSPANYQLNVMGNANNGWASGISLGSSSYVGASIVQYNADSNNTTDLLFYTKKTTLGNPTLSMSLKTDNRVIIGDWFGGTPTATLTVRDHTKDPLANISAVDNYQFGVYLPVNVGSSGGISFGSENFVGSSIVHTNTNGNNEGELSFYTKDNGVFDVSMIIKATGEVGIGVTDPFADLEVEGTLGVSNSFDGGSIEFRMNGATPSNTQELGRVRFGADSNTQASVYGVANENWGGTGLGTNVVISGTAVGGNTESPIVIFDHTQTDFVSPVNVNNSLSAITVSGTFIGNGAQITGIAQGSTNEFQFNNNGVFGGANFHYEPTFQKLSIGTTAVGAKLTIEDTNLDPNNKLSDPANYHLHISGNHGNGSAMGMGFGKLSSGVGAAIIYHDTGAYNKGELAFLTKSSTSNGADPAERMRIADNGCVGIGTSNPQAPLTVMGSTAILDNTSGGLLEFLNLTQYPSTGDKLGEMFFGSVASMNGIIQAVAPSNWTSGNRHTDLEFWATKPGQTTPDKVMNVAWGIVTVQGTVEATTFLGDGSQLTGINAASASGSNGSVQFYDNGNLSYDPSLNYDPVNNGLHIGVDDDTYGAGLLINDINLQPHFDPADHTRYGITQTVDTNTGDSTGIGFVNGTSVMSSIIANNISGTTGELKLYASTLGNLTPYLELGNEKVFTEKYMEISSWLNGENSPNLVVRGSSVGGEHAGIWMGTTNGTTHAKILATDSANIGMFKVMTRNSNGTHSLRMDLSSSQAYFYTNATFQNSQVQAERFSAIDTGRYPNYLHSNYHMSVQGSTTNKAGISFGNNGTAVAWGLVCDNNAYGDKRGDLKFTHPMNSTSTTMVDAMVIKGDTGRVGIGIDDPTYNLEVENHIGIHNTSLVGPQLNLSRDITAYSQMYSGVSMGRVNFDVSGYLNETAAYIIAKGDGTWSSTSRPTRMEFFTRASGTTTLSKKMTLDNGSIDLHVPTNIDGNLNVSNGNIGGSVGSVTCNFVYANQQIFCNALRGNSTNGNATINIIDYTESGSDRVRVNSTGSAADFCYVDGDDREILYCSSDGWVHLGCTDGQPQYDAFKWVADSSTSTGCYFEGYSAEHMAVFVNRNTGTGADGIAVILGDGATYSTIHSTYSNLPHTSQYYFTAYSKNKYTGSVPDNQPDFQGGIRANGSGGISWVASFTGMHASCTKQQPELKVGMIMISTGEMWYKKSIETALPKTAPTSTQKDKRAYGVIASLEGSFPNYAKFGGVAEDEAQIDINAIGEGCVLVTNIGGNIENGDYICSSEILGYGMLQDDDLLHNYTVAKCTENINWDDPELETIEHNGISYKIYLAACTYHCG